MAALRKDDHRPELPSILGTLPSIEAVVYFGVQACIAFIRRESPPAVPSVGHLRNQMPVALKVDTDGRWVWRLAVRLEVDLLQHAVSRIRTVRLGVHSYAHLGERLAGRHCCWCNLCTCL
jgi:hypothetical protein